MVYQKSTPSQIDFWKKFHDEWEELNRHTDKKRLVAKCKRQKPSKLEKPSKTWAGGQAVQTDKTVSRFASTDKTHDVSQRPCRLVWMPSLLAIPFLPKSPHV